MGSFDFRIAVDPLAKLLHSLNGYEAQANHRKLVERLNELKNVRVIVLLFVTVQLEELLDVLELSLLFDEVLEDRFVLLSCDS